MALSWWYNKLQTHSNYLAQTEPQSEMFQCVFCVLKKFVNVNSFH